MTEKQKELLFKDISARLPYGVKAYVRHYSKLDRKWYEGIYTIDSVCPSLNNIFVCSEIGSVEVIVGYDDYEIKPYLFPLDSMTEEQKDEIRNRFCYEWETDEDVSDLWKHELEFGYALEFIQWCYENHLDIGGLIPKGLAVDCTCLNIY
jgi:hypothetical protein